MNYFIVICEQLSLRCGNCFVLSNVLQNYHQKQLTKHYIANTMLKNNTKETQHTLPYHRHIYSLQVCFQTYEKNNCIGSSYTDDSYRV